MKISNEEVSRLLAFSPSDRGTTHSHSANSTALADTNTHPSDAATVHVSPSAYEVQQIKNLVNSLPDQRVDRVQALKAQIDNGSYKVSGEDIAELIIRRVLADNTAI